MGAGRRAANYDKNVQTLQLKAAESLWHICIHVKLANSLD